MPTPHDTARIALFRRWLDTHGGDLDRAHAATGINRRTIERIRAGSQPPPVRLLDELATDAAARGHADLAGELAAASQARGSHA